MKVLWRVAQVLFGILFALTIILILGGIIAKSNGAIICGVFLAVIALTLCTLMGKAAKATPIVDPISELDVSIGKFTGKVIESIGVSVPIGAILTVLATDNDNITLTNSALSFAFKKSQITYACVSFEQTPITKNKSVVGRGLVGAALMGTTGAVIGSASAIGGKQGVSLSYFAYIQFYSATQQECRLVFSVDEYEFRKADKFARAVNPAKKGTIQL